MSKRPIVIIPQKCLREVAQPVKTFDDALHNLVQDMFETMYDAPGVGLAAPQIAVMQRVIVMDPAKEDEEKRPLAMINPQVTWVSEEVNIYQEGCLSIPDYYEDVERPAQCKVSYFDLQGNPHEIACDGLLATVVQHEIDHLNGKLFIDYLSRLKRERVMKKFQKLAKRAQT